MDWTKITKSKLINLTKKDIFWVILIILLIIPVYYKLLKPGFFPMQDDLQAFRLQQMDKCFQDGQIPCRWVPDAGYQYGYPQFNFYPPLVYYVGEPIHLLGVQFIDTVKILFMLGYLLSAVAMYYLVKELVGRKPAFVSAILYTYIPYKGVEVYVRGALSEFWALIFFPLIFLYIYKVILTGRYKYVVFLALSITGLLLTHMLSAMMLLVPAALWSIYWLVIEKKKRNVILLGISGLLGFGLSSFYVIPVIFERKYVHMESLLMGYFDWRKHFIGLNRMLLSREWGYGSSGFPNEKLNLTTGLVQWVFAFFSGFIALVSYKRNKKISFAILILLFSELITLFLIHPRSNFIWETVSALQWLQFPWRFLAVSIFLLSIVAGLSISLINKKVGYVLSAILVISAIMVNINYYKPKGWLNINDVEKFSGDSWEKQLTISIFDYLPIYAKLPPVDKAPETPEILDGNAEFTMYEKGSDFHLGTLTVNDKATIRFPMFDFPGMELTVNTVVKEHWNDDCREQIFCLGLVTTVLDKGEYEIRLELKDTPPRRFGNYITLVSIAGAILIIYYDKKYRKISKK